MRWEQRGPLHSSELLVTGPLKHLIDWLGQCHHLLFIIVLAQSFCISCMWFNLKKNIRALAPSLPLLAVKLIRLTRAATIAAAPSRGEVLCIEKDINIFIASRTSLLSCL